MPRDAGSLPLLIAALKSGPSSIQRPAAEALGRIGNPTAVPQFVEQLALIHFFGHAVGFVDNGVPVGETNKAHIDTENPHHCTNTQCAMSFANESVQGAVSYAKQYIRNAEAVLIGQECLSDARLLESKQLTQ